MSDISEAALWEVAQRIAKHVVPQTKESQAAADEFERTSHHANGLGYYTLKELAERTAVKATAQEMDHE